MPTNPVDFADDLDTKLARLEREAALHADLVDALAKLDDMLKPGGTITVRRDYNGPYMVSRIADGHSRCEQHSGFGSSLAEALIRLANPNRNAT